MTDPSVLDNPMLLSILFHPRSASPGQGEQAAILDGTLPVEEHTGNGYRLFVHEPGAPVILYFHGNGEIAADYDGIAPAYKDVGASLLVVDYRGYGWSTGEPRISTLLPDAEAVATKCPEVLKNAGLENSPLFIMGRSLGSAPAIHLAHKFPQMFKGVIIESGFFETHPLLRTLGLPDGLIEGVPDPIENDRKVREISLPLLIIHGEQDFLIPVTNGQSLFDACPSESKRIVRIANAGHNDLLFYGVEEYFRAIKTFLGL
ncbi:alpha/beta hydrolase [Acidobacteriota bacterium]